MNKTIIKKLCYYFLLRDIPLLIVAPAIMSKLTAREFLLVLPGVVLWHLPLIIINALLFGAPYYHLLNRFLKGDRSVNCAWYGAGLVLLESILLKIAIYQDMELILVLFSFIYLLLFTLYYFKYASHSALRTDSNRN